MSRQCACADCRALREEEAERDARLPNDQYRLPIHPLPNVAGQPEGTMP